MRRKLTEISLTHQTVGERIKCAGCEANTCEANTCEANTCKAALGLLKVRRPFRLLPVWFNTA